MEERSHPPGLGPGTWDLGPGKWHKIQAEPRGAPHREGTVPQTPSRAPGPAQCTQPPAFPATDRGLSGLGAAWARACLLFSCRRILTAGPAAFAAPLELSSRPQRRHQSGSNASSDPGGVDGLELGALFLTSPQVRLRLLVQGLPQGSRAFCTLESAVEF